jgi:peptidyl-tRNA hydrolase, PTH1 family
MKLVVGLGNPGEKYIGVRHNIGFEAMDELARKLNIGNWSIDKKNKSEVIKTSDLILAKPQTYMNNSGLAVKQLATYYKIPTTDIIVIHDDLDLLLGKIKVRSNGAAGGHHGVQSIIESLGTDQFTRVRLGIGNDKSHSGEHNRIHFEAEKFVLEGFMPGERSKIKSMIKQAIKELESLISLTS